jgi:hypothetical protein
VSGTEPHPCKPPACSACVLRARTHPSRSGRPRASLSRPQWGIGSQGEREPNAARILASVVRTMADVFPLRRRRPSEAGRGCLPLREGRRRAIPNTRWPTSVTTSCSIRSLRGLSWNHAANRCIIPIARSVAPNKSPPASEVIAPPSTPRPPRDLQRVQTQTDLCYTLSASRRSAKQ